MSPIKDEARLAGEIVVAGGLLVRSMALLVKNSDPLSGLKISQEATPRSRAGRWWSRRRAWSCPSPGR